MKALYGILKGEEVNRFLPWFPVGNMDEARTFYETGYAAKYAEPQAYAYAVCLKENNIPIGYINVDMVTAMIWDMGFGKNSGTRGLPQRPERP